MLLCSSWPPTALQSSGITAHNEAHQQPDQPSAQPTHTLTFYPLLWEEQEMPPTGSSWHEAQLRLPASSTESMDSSKPFSNQSPHSRTSKCHKNFSSFFLKLFIFWVVFMLCTWMLQWQDMCKAQTETILQPYCNRSLSCKPACSCSNHPNINCSQWSRKLQQALLQQGCSRRAQEQPPSSTDHASISDLAVFFPLSNYFFFKPGSTLV